MQILDSAWGTSDVAYDARTGAGAGGDLLHVPFGDQRVCLSVMEELTAREEDALHLCRVRTREQRMAMMTSPPTNKVSDVFRDNGRGFGALFRSQVGDVYRCLKDRVVRSGEASELGTKGPQQDTAGVRDVEHGLHLDQDVRHEITGDLNSCYLGWFHYMWC